MQIQFEITADEIKEFGNAHQAQGSGKNFSSKFLGWSLILAVFFLVFVVFNNQKPATSSPPPATTPAAPVGNNIFVIVLLNLFPWVLIFIIIWFFFLRKISKDRHDQAAQIGFQTFDFTPELVTFTSSYCRNEYQWLAFTHFSESATIFLLYTSAITAHVIPKRAFATPADCDAFRQMALSKIQPPTKGFPVVMPEAFSAPTSKE